MLNKRFTPQGCIQNHTPSKPVTLVVSPSFIWELSSSIIDDTYQGEFLSHSIKISNKPVKKQNEILTNE